MRLTSGGSAKTWPACQSIDGVVRWCVEAPADDVGEKLPKVQRS